MVITPKPFEEVNYNQAKLNSIWREQLNQIIKDRENLSNSGLQDLSILGVSSLSITDWSYSFDYNPTTAAVPTAQTQFTITFPYLLDLRNVFWDWRTAAGSCQLQYTTDGINYITIASASATRSAGSLTNIKVLGYRITARTNTLYIYELISIGKAYSFDINYNPLM